MAYTIACTLYGLYTTLEPYCMIIIKSRPLLILLLTWAKSMWALLTFVYISTLDSIKLHFRVESVSTLQLLPNLTKYIDV